MCDYAINSNQPNLDMVASCNLDPPWPPDSTFTDTVSILTMAMEYWLWITRSGYSRKGRDYSVD